MVIRLQILIVLDCKTVGFFFLKIGLALLKNLTRPKSAKLTRSLPSLALRFQPCTRPFVWLLARTWIRKNTDCFAVYDRTEIWKCWFPQRREIGVPGEKPFWTRKEPTSNSTTYGLASGTSNISVMRVVSFLPSTCSLLGKRPRFFQAPKKQTYLWGQIVMSQFEFLTRPKLLVH